MMVKILIADDEPIFRDYLVHLTDWGALGLEICGEARNGYEALELASLHKPEIVLLDINMPLLDGLAVADQLKTMQEDIRIALVTGYNEFEYARKAIRIGVEDYILKPFKKEELLSTLLKFKAMIQQKQEEEIQAKDDLFFVRERFLNLLVSEEYDLHAEEIHRFFKKQKMSVDAAHYVVVTVEIDNLYQLWVKPKDVSLWKFAVSNVLEDLAGSSGITQIFNGPEGRIVAIHLFESSEAGEDFNLNGYGALCDYVRTYFRFTVTIGISRPVSQLYEIRQAYLETIIALQNKLIAGGGALFSYSSLNESGKGTGFNSMKWNEELLSSLRRHDYGSAVLTLRQIESYIRSQQLSVDFTYAILMSVVSLCMSYINEMSVEIEQVLSYGFRPYQQIKKMTSLDASIEWLAQTFRQTIVYFQEQKVSRTLQIVRDVQAFIAQHFSDCELSVENIARHFHMDSSYIRKAFARELNMNVAEYITNVRMGHAKLLLETSDMKLHELSDRIGYSDPGYFSKVFKKYFNLLPSEYMSKVSRL